MFLVSVTSGWRLHPRRKAPFVLHCRHLFIGLPKAGRDLAIVLTISGAGTVWLLSQPENATCRFGN
jgi:hypothetical protein